ERGAGATGGADRAARDRGGQLAAGAVDLAAAGVAHGHRDAVVSHAADELLLHAGPGGGPLRAGGRVERDQVHVREMPGQQAAQEVGAPRLVVDVPDQRVLDRDAAAGGGGVIPSRVENLGDLPPAVHRDELVAGLIVGCVQRDGE